MRDNTEKREEKLEEADDVGIDEFLNETKGKSKDVDVIIPGSELSDADEAKKKWYKVKMDAEQQIDWMFAGESKDKKDKSIDATREKSSQSENSQRNLTNVAMIMVNIALVRNLAHVLATML